MHRAGVGWSDPPFAPRTSTSIANELHELLHRAGVAPPYVLVGSSIGGEYARVFTAKYPTEVAGLVLVDSSHPDQNEPPRAKGPASRLPRLVREEHAGPSGRVVFDLVPYGPRVPALDCESPGELHARLARG